MACKLLEELLGNEEDVSKGGIAKSNKLFIIGPYEKVECYMENPSYVDSVAEETWYRLEKD